MNMNERNAESETLTSCMWLSKMLEGTRSIQLLVPSMGQKSVITCKLPFLEVNPKECLL